MYMGEIHMSNFISIGERDENIIREFLPTKENIYTLSQVFSGFADGTRLKILICLCMKQMCVGDIAELLHINQTTISHQLKYLKNLKLVDSDRTGKVVTYGINNKNIIEVLNYGVECL